MKVIHHQRSGGKRQIENQCPQPNLSEETEDDLKDKRSLHTLNKLFVFQCNLRLLEKFQSLKKINVDSDGEINRFLTGNTCHSFTKYYRMKFIKDFS